MDPKVNYKVHPQETIFFFLKLIISFGLYGLLIWLILNLSKADDPKMMAFLPVILFYLALIIVYVFFRFGILIGHLKGNAVKLNKNQFPDLYQTVSLQTELLGLKRVPDVFILQSGGVMNAFAARFLGRNYIVLFSEVVETAYEQDMHIIEFIIAHELGHIRRKHMIKSLVCFPASIIPFLGAAYSRACEYTCDNIGHALAPAGLRSGLLILASGRSLYKKVNLKSYLFQDQTEDGFWKWFAEKVSSHPNLTKRLASFIDARMVQEVPETVSAILKKETDHAKYMPQG